MSAVAIVPARGGSKGLPRKNVLLCAGEPLIVHTLRAASTAAAVDRVLVSTDDDEIAAVAEAEGVEVVRRPPALAADDSPTEDALVHVLDVLDERGEPLPEWVVTLEPTSPLRSAALIDRCVEEAVRRGVDALVTVAESREVWGHVEDGWFEPLRPSDPRRRQLREPLYREASAVYVTRTSHLRASRSVIASPLAAVVAPELELVDVNTAADLALADALLRHARA